MRSRLASAEAAWQPSDQPEWLTDQVYKEQIQPPLARLSVARLAAALAVSRLDASAIRQGQHQPHPRHWRALAALTGLGKH
jgi:hypothetical protein